MKKAPMNYLITVALGGLLWAVFGIFLMATFSEGPSLSVKAPEELANQLRGIFGGAALLGIANACYWYYYGDQPETATRLPQARGKYTQLFLGLVSSAIALTAVIWYLNRAEGMEAQWFAIYFGANLTLTAVFYWLATFLFSPNSVKYLPYGK